MDQATRGIVVDETTRRIRRWPTKWIRRDGCDQAVDNVLDPATTSEGPREGSGVRLTRETFVCTAALCA